MAYTAEDSPGWWPSSQGIWIQRNGKLELVPWREPVAAKKKAVETVLEARDSGGILWRSLDGGRTWESAAILEEILEGVAANATRLYSTGQGPVVPAIEPTSGSITWSVNGVFPPDGSGDKRKRQKGTVSGRSLAEVPALILEDPPQYPKPPLGRRQGWADEIAHEEQEFDNLYLEAHQHNFAREREKVVGAAEEYLRCPDIVLLWDKYFPGYDKGDELLYGILRWFAIGCLCRVDGVDFEQMARSVQGMSLDGLLRLAKAGGWDGVYDARAWTG